MHGMMFAVRAGPTVWTTTFVLLNLYPGSRPLADPHRASLAGPARLERPRRLRELQGAIPTAFAKAPLATRSRLNSAAKATLYTFQSLDLLPAGRGGHFETSDGTRG